MSNFQEIKDDVARAKLEGLQESVSSIDENILQIRESLKAKRGALSALNDLAQRIMLECNRVNAKVDKDEMATEEAKARIDEITNTVKITRAQAQATQNDMLNLTGQIVGMEKVVSNITAKFNSELAKYQRWEKIQEESESDVDELGRPIQKDTKELEPKLESKNTKPESKNTKPTPKQKKQKAPKKKG